MKEETKIKEDVWQTILRMNKLWTVDNKAEELVNYFHKNGEKILTTSEFMMMSFKVKDLLDISTEFKNLNDELDSTELEFFIIEGK